MNDKKIYTAPETEVIRFVAEDVIVTSNIMDPDIQE